MEKEMKNRTKVLYVEDDVDYAELIQEMLTKEGFQVEIAHTKAEAIRLFRSYRPNIALVDLDLNLQKEKEGLEVIQDIRRISKWFPIIVYSNDAEPETVIKTSELGALQHFEKSRTIQELVAIINNTIRHTYRFEEDSLIEHPLSDSTTFNLQTNTLTINKQQYKLKKMDGKLLQQLFVHINEYVSPQELSVAIWDSEKSLKDLRKYVSKLRAIIEPNDPNIKIVNKAIGFYKLECQYINNRDGLY